MATLLFAVGQPLFTDDLWWHLALGHAHLGQGPHLPSDPLLFTAPGPPAPASWLADAALALTERITGFQGLRLLHVALVLAILVGVGAILRRASGSWLVASVGTTGFAALTAYRLIQLRPHLFTILAALVLLRLLFVEDRPPTRWRIVGAAVLTALWANLHAGYVLAPMLVAAAAGATTIDSCLRWGRSEISARSGAMRTAPMLVAFAACTFASFLNPVGVAVYAPYLRAGASTPSLDRVGDEWAPTRPFEWPDGVLQPSVFVWLVLWLLLASIVVVAVRTVRRRGEERREPIPVTDWGLAVVAFVLAFSAVRFAWLAVVPLVTIARELGDRRSPGLRASVTAVFAAALVIGGFLRLGDARAVSGFLQLPLDTYAAPYPTAKYHAHAVWLMQDASVEGNLFNEYHLGGFLGYWLSPDVRTFVNGSLNVEVEAMDANWPLRNRRGAGPEESFLESLDRLGIDLFLGTGPPVERTGRPDRIATSGHLEGAPGWTLVFRNMITSLWIRNRGAGRESLERLAQHYAARGVPFDPERGFRPLDVARDAPEWARRHGLVPTDYGRLLREARSGSGTSRYRALDRIASVHSLLGEREPAIAIDRNLVRRAPRDPLPRRRLAWNLLHERSFDAIPELARAGRRAADPLLARIVEVASRAEHLENEVLASAIATMPLLRPSELERALAGFRLPEARPSRRGR